MKIPLQGHPTEDDAIELAYKVRRILREQRRAAAPKKEINENSLQETLKKATEKALQRAKERRNI